MKLNIQSLTIMIFAIFILVSCEESPVDPEAKIITIQEIAKLPGYAWFEPEVEKYEPNPDVISQIKQSFAKESHFFYLFIKPSCDCNGIPVEFPDLIKVFRESGIPESSYNIYSMLSKTNKYPFSDKFTIKELPAFMVMKSGEAVFSIIDTMDAYIGSNDSISIEAALLLGLEK